MFSTSHLYVAATIDEKLAAAAAERLASKPSTAVSLKARIDGVARSAWSLLSGPADRPATPTLVDYPFRG